MKYSFILPLIFFCLTSIALNAQEKYYVPELLYLNDDAYASGITLECFSNNDDKTDFTQNNVKYCLQYKLNNNGEKILVKRIEQVGEKWIVTNLTTNKQIIYKENKEVILKQDEISGFSKEGELISYKIFYYKTETK